MARTLFSYLSLFYEGDKANYNNTKPLYSGVLSFPENQPIILPDGSHMMLPAGTKMEVSLWPKTAKTSGVNYLGGSIQINTPDQPVQQGAPAQYPAHAPVAPAPASTPVYHDPSGYSQPAHAPVSVPAPAPAPAHYPAPAPVQAAPTPAHYPAQPTNQAPPAPVAPAPAPVQYAQNAAPTIDTGYPAAAIPAAVPVAQVPVFAATTPAPAPQPGGEVFDDLPF